MEPILHIDEFSKLPEMEQKRLLMIWRNTTMTNMQIYKAMGMDFLSYSAMCRRFELPRKKGRRQIEQEQK